MKKALIAILFISVISLAIFYYLGGFNPIEKTVIPNPAKKTIFGTLYKGKAGSDTLRMHFNKAKSLVENGNGNAIAILYFKDVDAQGQVENFIGIETNNNSLTDSTWTYREFTPQAIVQACIQSHPIVLPSPQNLLEELKEFASASELKADSIFVEYYRRPENVCVELFCQ